MKKAFDHIGIITSEPRPGESWVADSKAWVTNPRLDPDRIEYIRPTEKPVIPPDQIGLWKLWNRPHIAYRVDSLKSVLIDAAERGHEVILGPFFPAAFVEVAFIYEYGVIVEYMEYSDLDHWFGQPNPPGFEHEPLG